MNKKMLLATTLISLGLSACGGNKDSNASKNVQKTKTDVEKNLHVNVDTAKTAITTNTKQISKTIPSNLGAVYNSKNFNRYLGVKTPNGGNIHIIAQDKISDEQIERCKNVLKFYLSDYKGSLYGSNKAEVANKMAQNGAILVLLNGQDDGKNPLSTKVTGQPLYQNEIQVEGGKWYMAQNYEHRDATYEEILHFVHDNGIGVDGANTTPGALLEYQAKIRAAQKNAQKNKLWAIGTGASQVTEWTNENSLSQEYFASVVDSYYGLWGAWSESKTHGMWGMYIGKTREDMKKDDPQGYALMAMFFQPYITYNAGISANLNGEFSLKYDSSKPYTNHSRYLKDVTLLGSNNNNVRVNELDNHITGNSGENTVIFSGNSSQYTIETKDGVTVVKDKTPNRDGENTLLHVEKLKFKDKEINL